MSLGRISVLATVTSLSLSSSIALADPQLNRQSNSPNFWQQFLGQNIRGFRGQYGRGNLFEQLNLTETQTRRIQAIHQKYKQQITERQKDLRSATEELGGMMAGSNSTDVIRATHNQVVQLREELGQLHFESMLEMREVLTPEQRVQLAQMMQEHKQLFYNRFRNVNRSRDLFNR